MHCIIRICLLGFGIYNLLVIDNQNIKSMGTPELRRKLIEQFNLFIQDVGCNLKIEINLEFLPKIGKFE